MADGPIRLLNLVHALDGHEAAVENIVRRVMAVAEAHPGVEQVELFRDQRDPARLVSQIDFTDEESLESYLESDRRQAALADLAKHVQRDFQRFVLEPVVTQPSV